MSDVIEFHQAGRSDGAALFHQIADLHIDLIHGGILPLLGKSFLANLYSEIASSRSGCVFAAIQADRVVGFAAGAWDIWKCACGFRIRGYLHLTLCFLRQLASPRVLAKGIDSLAYPFRKVDGASEHGARDKHRAELLAIAVAHSAQGQGVGRGLLARVEDFFKPHVRHYFVTTNIAKTQSNAFYKTLGFLEIGCKKHHDLVLQTYIKQLN